MEFKEIRRGSTQAAIHFQVASNEVSSQLCLKVIRKEDVLVSEWDLATNELEIHSSASGLPHVIPVVFSERDDEQIVIAMARAEGGDLWEKIQYGGSTLSEGEAKRFASQLFHGLAALHQERIVHGDIKPHNILLIPHGERLNIALCDFGLARRLPSEPGRKFTYSEIRGTQGYIAPEICAGQDYDEKIDVFAAAIVVYRLIAGTEPFYPAENFTEEVDFHDDCCGHLSVECKDFLQSLLDLDPERRLSAAEALDHPWLTTSLSDDFVPAEAENELGLRFHHQWDLKQEPEELKLASKKFDGAKELGTVTKKEHFVEPKEPGEITKKEHFVEPQKRSREESTYFEMNQLSYSSSASTRCPDTVSSIVDCIEFDD